MVYRRRHPVPPFDGIDMLQLRRAARGVFIHRGADPSKRRGFVTRWKTWGAEVLTWADGFDQRHRLPPTTADLLLTTYGAPGPPQRRLRAVRHDEEDER